MKVALFALGLLASPLVFADPLGIQSCSDTSLNFKNVKQMRSFDNDQIRLYLIDKTVGQYTTNGLAITYGNYCRYISGFFETDLKKAVPTNDSSHSIYYVQLYLGMPEGEDYLETWMTVQIKKNAQYDRAAIRGWIK